MTSFDVFGCLWILCGAVWCLWMSQARGERAGAQGKLEPVQRNATHGGVPHFGQGHPEDLLKGRASAEAGRDAPLRSQTACETNSL